MADMSDKAEDMFDDAKSKANEMKGRAEQKAKDIDNDLGDDKKRDTSTSADEDW